METTSMPKVTLLLPVPVTELNHTMETYISTMLQATSRSTGTGFHQRRTDLQQEREALIRTEQMDGILANYYGRVLNENNRVFGPIYKLRDVKRSEWDTHAPLVLKYIEGEKRYNPIVMQELRAANPQNMDQVIGVVTSAGGSADVVAAMSAEALRATSMTHRTSTRIRIFNMPLLQSLRRSPLLD